MAVPQTVERRSPEARAARAREDAIVEAFLAERRATIERARRITFDAILNAPDEASLSRWTREHERLYFRRPPGPRTDDVELIDAPVIFPASLRVVGSERTVASSRTRTSRRKLAEAKKKVKARAKGSRQRRKSTDRRSTTKRRRR